METFLGQYGYYALTIGTFFEGETAILVASSLIHKGLFAVPYTIFFGFLGSFISDWLYYLIGRWNGRYFISRRPKLQARLLPLQHFFAKHQVQILFTYRFLYGFRIIIPVMIGMSHISPLRYLGYSLLTGIMWATTVSSVGYVVGRFLNLPVATFEENLLFIVLGFATLGIVIGYTIKRIAMRGIEKEA